jgi:hypothetical protein
MAARLSLNPTFTITGIRATFGAGDPLAILPQERFVDGLRKAGVPEV